MKIVRATFERRHEVVKLALKLWDNNDESTILKEITKYISNGKSIIYLAKEEKKNVGFLVVSLRTDYVEGTKSTPVAYLEGIFVEKEFRGKGIGKSLLKYGEQWAIRRGCLEMASDCQLFNENSLKFHLQIGFKEANRVICFSKCLRGTRIMKENEEIRDKEKIAWNNMDK